MKIGTYNLEFLFDAGTRLFSGKEYDFSQEYVDKRFAYFAQEFDGLDADILFLQELGDASALTKILTLMKNKYSYFIAEPDTNGIGNAVIFKKDIVCTCNSIPTNASLPVFNNMFGERIQSRRDYVEVKTTYKGKDLLLLGIHIKSNFLMYENDTSIPPEGATQTDTDAAINRSKEFRLSQAKKIREVIDLQFQGDENAQTIVLGDFNARSGNEILKIIRGNTLIPILDVVPENKRYSIIGREYNGLIDHVLISKPLEQYIEDVLIHNDKITDHSTSPDYPYIIESDHAPITFKLNE